MAGMPIDFKEVLNAFGDIDAARLQSVSVCVLLDPSAPADLADFARECFATTQPNARVVVGYYEDAQASVPYGCDLAVLVAALSEHTGRLALRIREAGCPVLVVTTLPDIVRSISVEAGAPLLDADLVSPAVPQDKSALPEVSDYYAEPYPLDEARIPGMREEMGQWVVDVFKNKKLAFALCFPFVRKPLALDAVKATSAQNAAVGAVVLIPGADMPVMTLNQAKMILQIAAAYGQKMGMERAKELAGVVAGAFALRTAARQVVGVVPGFGWAVKGGIGYAGTLAMGHAAIAYFESTVENGRPAEEALDAARAEAQRVADILQSRPNAASGVAAVAKDYVGRAQDKVRSSAGRAIPAIRNAIGNVAEVGGSTPSELGKKAVQSFSDTTGATPVELGKRVVRTALSGRKK